MLMDIARRGQDASRGSWHKLFLWFVVLLAKGCALPLTLVRGSGLVRGWFGGGLGGWFGAWFGAWFGGFGGGLGGGSGRGSGWWFGGGSGRGVVWGGSGVVRGGAWFGVVRGWFGGGSGNCVGLRLWHLVIFSWFKSHFKDTAIKFQTQPKSQTT